MFKKFGRIHTAHTGLDPVIILRNHIHRHDIQPAVVVDINGGNTGRKAGFTPDTGLTVGGNELQISLIQV